MESRAMTTKSKHTGRRWDFTLAEDTPDNDGAVAMEREGQERAERELDALMEGRA